LSRVGMRLKLSYSAGFSRAGLTLQLSLFSRVFTGSVETLALLLQQGFHGKGWNFSSSYSEGLSRIGLRLQLFLFSRVFTGRIETPALFFNQGFRG
jgi:hypothetical protein